MYKTSIIVPDRCILDNLKFTRKEHTTVIASMLMQINLPLLRSNKVYVKIRNFGVVSTHGNRKRAHIRHMEKYNKAAWKKLKKEKDFSEKKLLF